MGVVDKLKKILFDEEEVEIPVTSGELPERELRIVSEKSEKKTPTRSAKKEIEPTRSFKDYRFSDDEDTIVELKVPQDDEYVEEKKSEPEHRIKFPIDDFDDFEDDYIPTRTTHEEEPPKAPVKSESSKIPKYINNVTNEPKKESREEKDYRKIIHDLDDENKKPFEVTPIISPVFGVLNKNYKQEELEEKKALITQTNSGAKPRLYGPVSYNDAPLPKPHMFESKKMDLKEELVELNSTISDLINGTDDDNEIELPAKVVEEVDYPKTMEIPKILDTRFDDDDDDDEEEAIIETENYDEIPSSIESPIKEHTNIEDAFEPTSEFDQITDYDREVEKRSIEEEIDNEIEDEQESYDEDFVTSYKIEDEDELTDLDDFDKVNEVEDIEDFEDVKEEEEAEEVEVKPVRTKKTSTKKSNVRKAVEIDKILDASEDEENGYDDDEGLTDTIETDLFNLIDSMYKDDEEDSEEE